MTPLNGVCCATETVHGDGPPPASARVNVRLVVVPRLTRPKERPVGVVKTSGLSARTRSMRPPPSRRAEISVVEPGDGCTGSPVVSSADLICSTVHDGWRCFRTAAAPATCGDAMLVPLQSWSDQVLRGSDDRMSTPGPVTSGFICSEIGVGPPDEKSAITSAGPESPSLDAATLIACGAVAGDPTDPLPLSRNSLPAATTGITPASAALSSAATTMSRDGSISDSPSERLITSMPSFTASSMPFAISGEFPSRPKLTVGTVSTL